MNTPVGIVTLLFTDIEGSTRLWERHPEAMRVALARHDSLLRETMELHGGHIFKTVGDAFCAVFATATDAVAAALRVQLVLLAEPWPEQTTIKVRMALHTGAVESRDNDYFGPPLNRVARLLATGHGGQTLLSLATSVLARDSLPPRAELRSLGEHRLKDLGRPESVFQLCYPDLTNEFAPLRSLDNPDLRHNLPQQVTNFIGREQPLVEVRALLQKTRLLTLTGSGGCGKTRLALQVAAELVDGGGEGVWLVELAPLTDPGLVPQAVASVLGLKEEPGKQITQSLVEHLKKKHLLLLLDNCEHVLDACAQLADTLTRQCPGVRILASSREVLGISGETTYRVPSLSFPDLSQHQTPESLSQFEAVRLFIERALQAQISFVVTKTNALALASICHRLDGIPLAIEMAAARVRSMPMEQIEQRLDQRFRLLTGGSRTALPRQQTLRSLIDWSYDLLSDAEKALLCRLSVFVGGWTLESAESICSGDPIEDWEVLDLLTSLCDKSLVVAEPSISSTRYRLLETIRQYAQDRLLERGEGDVFRDRHLSHFLALAEETEAKLKGADQALWLDRLERAHDNFRAALEWSAASPARAELGLRLAGAICWFWHVRGYLSEGREQLTRALSLGMGGDPLVRAKTLNGAGSLAWGQGDYASARAFFEESLGICRERGDRQSIANSLGNLGAVAEEQGDYGAARALHEESLAIRRELGDKWGIGIALNNLGNVANDLGDNTTAWALYSESLVLARELGDQEGIGISLGNLGYVATFQGDYAVAWTLLKESLAIFRELGNRQGIAYALNKSGNVAASQGDYASAGVLHKESLVVYQELGDQCGIAASLEGIAQWEAILGVGLPGACLWGAAARLREEIGSPLPPLERERAEQQYAAVRTAVGQEAFAIAWAEGRALSVEQAIALALRG